MYDRCDETTEDRSKLVLLKYMCTKHHATCLYSKNHSSIPRVSHFIMICVSCL